MERVDIGASGDLHIIAPDRVFPPHHVPSIKNILLLGINLVPDLVGGIETAVETPWDASPRDLALFGAVDTHGAGIETVPWRNVRI
jgi:hypothetical protein